MADRKTRLAVWLSEVLGPCSHTFRKLLAQFGSFEEIYERKSTAEMAACLSPRAFSRARTMFLDDVERIAEYCDSHRILMLHYADPRYPGRLRDSAAPPVVLYLSGDAAALRDPCIAGVGTRRPTQYGRDAVRFLCEPLAAAGVTLVSGLAFGIDLEVHKAALRVGAKTVAVLGNGIDTTYPAQHREVRAQIEQNGAVVSEYPPFTENAPFLFPLRNRIIAALSAAVIIFEAAGRSGTMITAEWALDDGREVFAVPGSILSDRSEGTNRLIQQGAAPALSAAGILEALGLEKRSLLPAEAKQVKEANPEKKAPLSLEGADAEICRVLTEGGLALDQLVERTRRAPGELLARLTMLELDGVLQSLPGQRYQLL